MSCSPQNSTLPPSHPYFATLTLPSSHSDHYLSAFLPFCHTFLPAFCFSSILPFLHTAILPICHSVFLPLPFCHSSSQSFHPSSILLSCHPVILPFSLSAFLAPCHSAILPLLPHLTCTPGCVSCMNSNSLFTTVFRNFQWALRKRGY